MKSVAVVDFHFISLFQKLFSFLAKINRKQSTMPVLSDERILKLKDAFKKADIDKTGTVTGAEIEAHLNSLFEEEGLEIGGGDGSANGFGDCQ